MNNKGAWLGIILPGVAVVTGVAFAAPITFEAKGVLTDAPTPPVTFPNAIRKCQKGVLGIPAFPAGTPIRFTYSFDTSVPNAGFPPAGSYQTPTRTALALGDTPTVTASDPDAYLAVNNTNLDVELFQHISTFPDGTTQTHDVYFARAPSSGRLAGPEIPDAVSGVFLEQFYLQNFGTLYTTDGPLPEAPPVLSQNQLNEIIFSTSDLTTCRTSSFHLSSLEKVVPDLAPPAISFVMPTQGQQLPLGSAQTFSYRCSDPMGVATCLGTFPSGSPVDTTRVGDQSLTVLAEDASGNQTSQTIIFSVVRLPGQPADPGKPTDPGPPTNPGPPPGKGPGR